MTGLNLFDKAMEMLGYVNEEGLSGKDEMLKKALTLINNVYAELYYVWNNANEKPFTPLKTINDELDLPDIVLHDIAPYGVAMYLAQSESDADNQSLYASIYNQKKTRVIKISSKHKLPHIWE